MAVHEAGFTSPGGEPLPAAGPAVGTGNTLSRIQRLISSEWRTDSDLLELFLQLEGMAAARSEANAGAPSR
jgi:hypothetical protein